MTYPCFGSYDEEAIFCLTRCEFAPDCKKESGITESEENEDMEAKFLHKVSQADTKLREAEREDYLDILVAIPEIEVLTGLLDYYRADCPNKESRNAVIIALDAFLSNPDNEPKKVEDEPVKAKVDDVDVTSNEEETLEEDSPPEEEVVEETAEVDLTVDIDSEEDVISDVSEEPPKDEEDTGLPPGLTVSEEGVLSGVAEAPPEEDPHGPVKKETELPEAITEEYLAKVGGNILVTMLAKMVEDGVQLLQAADYEHVQQFKNLIESVVPTANTSSPSANEYVTEPSASRRSPNMPEPVESENSKEMIALYKDCVEKVGKRVGGQADGTRFWDNGNNFTRLVFEARTGTWYLKLKRVTEEQKAWYPECEPTRSATLLRIDFSKPIALDYFFKHAEANGHSKIN